MATTYFAILTQPRSGSEYFCTLLNSHPAILCHRELFNGRHIVHVLPKEHPPELDDLTYRDRDRLGFLQHVLQASASACPQESCVGFKLFLRQDRAILEHLMRSPEWRILLLERRNKLAQFSSLVIARETATWNAFRGRTATQHRIALDLEHFARFLKTQTLQSDRINRRLASRGNFLRIVSERIAEDLTDALRFLNVSTTARLTSRRARQNSTNMRQRIVNWEEVEDYLRRHGLEDWAVEDNDLVAQERR